MAETIDQEFSTSVDDAYLIPLYNTFTVGQKFKVSKDGQITALELHLLYISGAPHTITVRIGTSQDLTSSYLAEVVSGNITASGYFRIDFAAPVDVVASTTYYIGFLCDAASGELYMHRSNTSSYADGNEIAADGGDWNMYNNYTNYDMTARIYMGGTDPTAAITGTATASITEADVVSGGKTIVITLTGDTFIA